MLQDSGPGCRLRFGCSGILEGIVLVVCLRLKAPDCKVCSMSMLIRKVANLADSFLLGEHKDSCKNFLRIQRDLTSLDIHASF